MNEDWRNELITKGVAIDALNGIINRFEQILRDIRESKVDDSVCGMCEYDGAYMGQSGDWCNECPGFDKDDCFKLSDECRKRWLKSVDLPPAQSSDDYERGCEQVKEAVEEAKNAVLSVIKSEPHWTLCSEELPKENGHYLVTFHQTATEEDLGFDMDDTDVRKMRYDTKHGWRTPRRIPSWINDAVVSTVLAWMPLPEPYKAIDAMRSLPSAQPEQLTDAEQRIFLKAIEREEKVCKKVDEEWGSGDEECEINLVHVCHEIIRKVKGALWT